MQKCSIIVSLKYAPGLFKEFTLLGNNLAKNGCRVVYILSKHYQSQSEKIGLENVFYISSSLNAKEIIQDVFWNLNKITVEVNKIFQENIPNFICIYNPHPLNFLILKKAEKINQNSIRSIYLHEPHKPDKHLYGAFGSIYFKIVDVCQALSINHCNSIILPSPYALELFRIRFPQFQGAVHVAPILIPDTPVPSQKRKYFTIAGGMNEGKGLDTFCQLIEYTAKLGLDYHFRICTTSKIDSYINSLSESAQKIILIENPDNISDYQMFCVHAESKAFFLLHTTATQSGAMTVAFMNGTPVIARSISAFSQFIIHEKNSYLVPKDCNSADLIKAMQHIEANQNDLSIAARQTFEDTFSEKLWKKNYLWLLNLLNLN